MGRWIVLLTLSLLAGLAQAEVRTRPVTYRDGEVELRGYLAWDDAFKGKRPGVLVAHEWWGLDDYIRRRARMLAELGYVAFALDLYGEGRVTQHGAQAQEWMEQISANEGNWRKRALAGVEILRGHELVDRSRLAAVGYCFGGATVMQMAYAGADLKAVVSFHGSLPIPDADQAKKIRARVLAAHGSEDSFVPPERVREFQAALDRADVDWRMITFGNARHAFTNPEADRHGMENLRYDEQADRRSWAAMRDFFKETLDEQAGGRSRAE